MRNKVYFLLIVGIHSPQYWLSIVAAKKSEIHCYTTLIFTLFMYMLLQIASWLFKVYHCFVSVLVNDELIDYSVFLPPWSIVLSSLEADDKISSNLVYHMVKEGVENTGIRSICLIVCQEGLFINRALEKICCWGCPRYHTNPKEYGHPATLRSIQSILAIQCVCRHTVGIPSLVGAL